MGDTVLATLVFIIKACSHYSKSAVNPVFNSAIQYCLKYRYLSIQYYFHLFIVEPRFLNGTSVELYVQIPFPDPHLSGSTVIYA